MLIAELIERKRDGGELDPHELRELLTEYMGGGAADYQMSAFLMAVYFQGLSPAELAAFTRAMIESGARLDLRGGAPAVDKHSTGGVGDKVSLVLAPLLAEAGLRVPMMSGRGLGHTGGTLDKLESIPGFRTDLDLDEFLAVLADVGCAMIGQTPRIAPLDGRLYALRDVTGTVQSIPLIASSIISKKVAEGIEALVLDVKCGSGAFMREEELALSLARTLVELAAGEGLRSTALVTGMDEPLGAAVGNALEVREAVDVLRGGGPPDVREVTLALAAELCVAADGAADPDGVAADRSGAAGAAQVPGGAVGRGAQSAAPAASGGDRSGARQSAPPALERILDSGRALERLARLIERQGGDPSVTSDPDRLPAAPHRVPLPADASGYVAAVDARAVGLAAVELGAGRTRVGEAIDPAVGFEMHCRVGAEVDAGEPLATIHAASAASAERAGERLRDAIRLAADPPPPPPPLVRWRITPEGVEPYDEGGRGERR